MNEQQEIDRMKFNILENEWESDVLTFIAEKKPHLYNYLVHEYIKFCAENDTPENKDEKNHEQR